MEIQGLRGLDREGDGLLVEHGKRAGHGEANGTHVGVWLGAEEIRAGAENLGFGEKLHVHFEADDGLILGLHRGCCRDCHMEIDYNGWRGGQWSRRADKS